MSGAVHKCSHQWNTSQFYQAYFCLNRMRMFSRYQVIYSKTCVRQPPLKLTIVVDVKRWLSYKGTCHVILLAKLHDMYLYKTDNFFHINRYLKSVSKVAVLHRFYCMSVKRLQSTTDFPYIFYTFLQMFYSLHLFFVFSSNGPYLLHA